MSYEESFIEVQFPVSKISKESYKERKAGQSQTLTGLGKWWGRKPLILVRSTILGLLMPASDKPLKDREIFLKILMMDSEGIWNRKNKPMKDETIIENLTFKELKDYFEVPVDLFTEGQINQDKLIKQALKKDIGNLNWRPGASKEKKDRATKLAFDRLSYDDRLEYCLRPEETKLIDEEEWKEINLHLGTNANTIQELMKELGVKKFGYVPTVGDCFAGGGSIPFEAARIGLKAYASDLNPLAGLLTWAGLNILSLPEDEVKKLKDFQEKVFDKVAKQIEEWGIEKNEKGWMAKYYLYCNETVCPHCKTKVPMAPSWWVSKKTKTVAIPKHNATNNNFDLEIIQNSTIQQIAESEKMATIKGGNFWCPKCNNITPIAVLRRDDIDTSGNTVFGLRRWEANEFLPRHDDIFQERLYAIKYLEKNNRKSWEQFLKKPGPATDATYGRVHYSSPTKDDLAREEKVISLLRERFSDWQKNGYLPSLGIEPGSETTRLERERGWQFWHQLFNPRQLLMCGLFACELDKLSENLRQKVFGIISLNRAYYYASKICLWDSSGDKGQQTFYNQTFNTIYNFPCRGLYFTRCKLVNPYHQRIGI
jgi:putative DNA methylase